MIFGRRRRIAKAWGPSTTSAAAASVSVAIFLLGLKGYGAWITGSMSMLGSLADTGLDLLASMITLWGVRVAAMPADWDHRFGHGKAEALAAFVQSVFISLSALAIGWRALEALLSGQRATEAEFGIAVSLIAIVVTALLLVFQRRVIARTGSVAIRADYLHYKSDLLLNGAVIGALLLDSVVGWQGVDAGFGLLIALWLLWNAARAGRVSVDQLMDKEWPAERRREFLEAAAAIPALAGIHDLRTRTSGSQDFAQFHIFLDPDISVAEAHRRMDAGEKALAARFPAVEMLIHIDPEGHVDDEGLLPSALTEEKVR